MRFRMPNAPMERSPSVFQQAAVDEDGDAAGAHVHYEGRHADAEHVEDDFFLQPQAPFLEPDVAGPAAEVVKHPYHADELREDGRQCGTPHPPFEPEDEERREDDVTPYGEHRREHRFPRIARGAHDVVQSDHHVRYGRAYQDDLHKLACVADGGFGGAEEVQDGVEEDERDASEHDGIDHAQDGDIAQDVFGSLHVFLPQTDG